MSPFASHPRRIAVASLGVLLLVTAVFAPFGSIAWTHEYSAERVTSDDPHLAEKLYWAETTVFCEHESEGCELAYSVKDDGPRVVSETTYSDGHGFGPEKDVFIFHEADPRFYQSNVTHYENDTTRVDLMPVSNATALELASRPASRFPRGVERIVEEGTVRVDRPLAGYPLWEHTQAVIEHDGEYYLEGPFRYREWMESVADLLRLAVLAAGAALTYYAGRIE